MPTDNQSNPLSSQDENISNDSTQKQVKKIKRTPVSISTVLKFVGSVLLVSVIFFGSFLAYVAFNPDQTVFFVNIFNIDPADLKNLLKILINGSFGVVVAVFSIVWIITLFRAIYTSREQKRKRLLSWLLAGLIGIVLFSIIGFWAYLFNIVGATDYTNPGWVVTVYDNDLYSNESTRSISRLKSTENLIWPISIKYDLSTNAQSIAKKKYIDIESFNIDTDGARCNNGKTSINGTRPDRDSGIICTFDEIKTYMVRGTYTGTDRMWKTQTISIPLEAVEIRWLLSIDRDTNRLWQNIITINASSIKNLWEPRWIFSTNPENEVRVPYITETISKSPLTVCLKVMQDKVCDRKFVIQDTDSFNSQASLIFEISKIDPLSVAISLSGWTFDEKEIVDVEWITQGNARICANSDNTCNHTFSSFGKHLVTATITRANNKKFTVSGHVNLEKPLILARHGKIFAQNGKLLNTKSTFDPSAGSRGSYVIKNLSLPLTVSFDARDVITENEGYNFKDVTWTINDNRWKVEEKLWAQAKFTALKSTRYTIVATYTFQKNIITSDADTRIAQDTFILDLERKELQPIMNITYNSDYVPARITVDASSSYSAYSEIKKFIFDFGEGRPAAMGDAIQTYQYITPGEKNITLTIINAAGEKATITQKVVLKDTPKRIGFSSSMSPGVINMPVNFIADQSTGQIESYIWNFGDNTPISRWYDVTHTFKKAWTYTIKLTVRYLDGTEKNTTQTFKVVSSLE